MPRQVQPQSLQDVCVARAALMISDVCRAVEKLRFDHDCVIEGVQAYFLSYILPLYDRVCNAVDRNCLSTFGVGVLLCLSTHDRIAILNLRPRCVGKFFSETSLLAMIDKLTNLVELDTANVHLTANMLKTICRMCKKLEKITFTCDLRYSKLPSLRNLLKCRELRYVDIKFCGWEDRRCEPWLAMLIMKLPKLEMLKNWSFTGMSKSFLNLNSPLQLRELKLRYVYGEGITKIVHFCPHARHVCVVLDPSVDSWTKKQERDTLRVLAESSLQIETLRLVNLFTISKDFLHLLELKGRNITKLMFHRCSWALTEEGMCVIGSNCPVLEELVVSGCFDSAESTSEACGQAHTACLAHPRPPMFRRLKLLSLYMEYARDPRALQCVVTQANGLTSLKVVNMCVQGDADLLSEILDANTPTELESLILEEDSNWCLGFGDRQSTPVSQLSLERLLSSCPKLCLLKLWVPLKLDASLYINRLRVRVKEENLDLTIDVAYHSQDSLVEVDDDTDDYD